MTIKFLNKVIPKNDESLHSFLFRTARANYHENITSIIPECSAFYTQNSNELHENLKWVPLVKDLVESLNQDINQLVCNRFDDKLIHPSIVSKNRTAINYGMNYLRKSTKYCPECLKDENFHRLSWDLLLVTACTKHNSKLITRCTSCNGKIKLNSLMVGKCMCGYRYTDANPRKVTDSVITNNQKIVQGALVNEWKQIKRCDGSFLTADEYLQIFDLFYRTLRSLPTEGFIGAEKHPNFDRFFMYYREIAGFEINYMNFLISLIHDLVIQPDKEIFTLFIALDEIKKGRGGTSNSSAKSHILKELFESQHGGLYTNFFRKYKYDYKNDYYKNGRATLSLDHTKSEYLVISVAGNLIGTTPKAIRNMCKMGFLEYKIESRNGKEVYFIEKKSVVRWVRKMERCMTRKETSELLGINAEQFTELVNTNLIKAIHGPRIDGYSNYYVDKESVYNLEKLILSHCKEIKKIDDRWSNIKQTKGKLVKVEVSFTDLILLAIDGKLQVGHLKSESAISGLYFLKKEIQVLRLELFKKLVIEKGYTKSEVMEILNIGKNNANKWFEEGIFQIHYSKQKNGLLFPYVNRKQVLEKLIGFKGYSEKQAVQRLEKWDVRFTR